MHPDKLENAKKDAEKMGFVKAQPINIEYLVVPNYPSVAPIIEKRAQTVAKPTSAESMQEGIWLVIEGGLNDLMRGESRE